MTKSLCQCGHPHVNPDGSGSCSKFTCPCRAFQAAASEDDFCPADPECGCAANEPCKREGFPRCAGRKHVFATDRLVCDCGRLTIDAPVAFTQVVALAPHLMVMPEVKEGFSVSYPEEDGDG